MQYPPKFLKIYIPDTYEEQRGKLKAFLCQLNLFFEFNTDKFQAKIKRIFKNADEKFNAERRLSSLI